MQSTSGARAPRATANNYGELERLSALETLKTLSNPGRVKLSALVEFLESRGLWAQFAKITLADLKEAFGKPPEREATADAPPESAAARKRRRRILTSELTGDSPASADDDEADQAAAKPVREAADGGLSSDEVASMVLPFIEGNGDVTIDDIAEYTALDRKVLRHHMGVLIKQDKLERLGTGRNAVYSTLG